mmetsp:Transcript_25423/g.39665  ORF Transcript_25423/g.39665 Transcript_25423/m.39665 type:complete len:106 (+) Transcript_25423:507-824(+)
MTIGLQPANALLFRSIPEFSTVYSYDMSLRRIFTDGWKRLIQKYAQKDDNRQSRRIHISIWMYFVFIAFMITAIWFKYEEYVKITHRREMLETPEGITEVDSTMI